MLKKPQENVYRSRVLPVAPESQDIIRNISLFVSLIFSMSLTMFFKMRVATVGKKHGIRDGCNI